MSESEPEQFVEASAGKVVVNRVSIRTPPFSKDRPALWFASLEAQFNINNITQQLTKFYYAIAHLDTGCTHEVEDIILQPPEQDPYNKLRDTIISRFSVSREEKIRCLLEKEQMGDRKPSSFYRHLLSLAGPIFPEQVLKTIWMSRLPLYLQTVLTAQQLEKLSDLGDLADKLMEINSQPSQFANNAIATSSSAALLRPENQIDELNKKIEELTRVVASLSARDDNQRARSRQRYDNHRRRRSKSRDPTLCFYHDRFATKARKCVAPCSWSGPSPPGGTNALENQKSVR